MNNEDFVTYEIAQTLKECGFDWPCDASYTKEDASDGEAWLVHCCDQSRHQGWPLRWLAPTLWKAQKWLREKHGFYVEPHFNFDCHVVTIVDDEGGYEKELDDEFESYESALSAGLTYALNLLTKND